MSLDDERMSWKHAEQIERDATPQTVERIAAERIGRVISKHLDPGHWHTPRFWTEVGAKSIAHRGYIRGVFDELDADPRRIGAGNEPQRRQQQTARLDDADFWAEHVGHLRRELVDAEAIWERVKAGHVDRYDPDTRAADEDDARVSRERADAAAATAVPKGIAS